jgi:hypothetical protein
MMTLHHRENYDTAKRDDVDATVSEIFAHLPITDAHSAAGLKSYLRGILSNFYDRAAEEGKYLEIVDPSYVS